PWDVVQDVGELHKDAQVQANNLVQTVDYGDGTTIPLVAVPMLFDGEALPARLSPDLGADSDEVLASLGYDEDAIIDLKVKGVVFGSGPNRRVSRSAPSRRHASCPRSRLRPKRSGLAVCTAAC